MTPLAAELLALKQAHLLPCVYPFYQNPPVLVRGAGAVLYDHAGHAYTDFYSGVTVMNCGHANPAILDPALAQARVLQHTTTIYLTQPLYRLAERLTAFIGGGLTRAFFVNSGSEANEGALLLAKLATGRRGFIALRGGLHGRTAQTIAVTGIDLWRTDPDPPANVRFAPRPHCAACEFGCRPGACAYECVEAVRQLLNENPEVAALIAEPIQGNGGIVVPPPDYFPKLRALLDEFGVLLIFDEVQCGFGRTGARFRHHTLGVTPDILTLAKALGNGFPIGAFCAREAVAQAWKRPGASTTGGNALSATAALAVLDFMETQDLPGRAQRLGALLHRALAEIAQDCPWAWELRGAGLMWGLELRAAGRPLTAETDAVLEAMKDRGFLIGKTGLERNVLTFLPPLIIGEAEIAALAAALRAVLLRGPEAG